MTTSSDGRATPVRRDIDVTQLTDDVREGEVQVPPVQPDVVIVWSVDEAKALPEGTVLTWMESDRIDPDRHAAVITHWDGEPYIRHTRSDYWENTFDIVCFPALAFTWPSAGIADPRAALKPGQVHQRHEEGTT